MDEYTCMYEGNYLVLTVLLYALVTNTLVDHDVCLLHRYPCTLRLFLGI